VRKVTPDGKISLVAGDGMAGFAGDGGPADRASLRAPTGVEIGPDGALYIADAGNNRVRRVSGGVITTIAGNGSKDFGGDGGSALNAGLFTPTEIAFGPDRKLYVLDVDHARIRRIDLVSGTISTVAGNGEPTASGDGGPPLGAGLGAPRGLAIDSAGNLYVTDVKSGRLRIVRPARNRISLPPD
jgi:sugar lactone lactonase YvrE